MAFTPARNSYSRVFLLEGRARADRRPSYQSAFAAGGVEQSFGDVESIKRPDPYKRGEFIETGEIRGAKERATTSLTGLYAADLRSELLRLGRQRCPVDLQIHFGDCDNPSDFNSYTKVVVLERAYLTNVGTDELGTLDEGNQSDIQENTDISAADWYEVVPLKFTARANDIATREILDIVISDSAACGSCGDESDGCQKVYALQAGDGVSAVPDVLYSNDGGSSFDSAAVDALAGTATGSKLGVLGRYVAVLDDSGIAVAETDGFRVGGTPEFSLVTTGLVLPAGAPNDIAVAGQKAFVVGDGGYVYDTEDVSAGVSVRDAGSATIENLNSVDAYSPEMAVAVGANNAVVYTTDGENWAAVDGPEAAAELLTVAVKNDSEWFVGTATGRLWATTNGGLTWSERVFSNSGTGEVTALAVATPTVIYMAHKTAGGAGRALRSLSSGNSWVIMPEGNYAMPANAGINAIAACAEDANRVLLGGVAAGDDGFIGLGLP